MLADSISMRTRTWRCVLVLLFAVAGIVTGILAMHVVSTPMGEPHGFVAVQPAVSASTVSHPDQSHPAVSSQAMSDTRAGGGCAIDGCDPMHDTTAMICTLALLAATILLIAPVLSRALLGLGSRAAPTTLARMITRRVGSSPPSLLALFIDRR
ncbi:DUF6153 family protein [Leifsonia sp. L25]|uniref:DUF6153 family protein n=1 Tax=Leifsonia sp. L25 TaxID=3423957 RepID=UPI003D69C25E